MTPYPDQGDPKPPIPGGLLGGLNRRVPAHCGDGWMTDEPVPPADIKELLEWLNERRDSTALTPPLLVDRADLVWPAAHDGLVWLEWLTGDAHPRPTEPTNEAEAYARLSAVIDAVRARVPAGCGVTTATNGPPSATATAADLLLELPSVSSGKTAAAPVAEKRAPGPSKIDAAIGLKYQEPGLTDAEIAKRVDCTPENLYGSARYKDVRKKVNTAYASATKAARRGATWDGRTGDWDVTEAD